MHVGTLLEIAADACPDRIAVGSLSGGMTYAELRRRAEAAAVDLARNGAEHLAVIDLNSEAIPVALFAAAFAGVPFAPLNYRLADDQLLAVAARVAPAVVVVDEAVRPRLGTGISGLQLISRDDLLRSADVDDPPGATDPDSVAVLLFTSGTTGEPKAAVLRHRHLAGYILGSLELLSADPSDAALVSVPPYHVAGIAAILSSVWMGRRIVYLPQFDADEWVKTIEAEEITHAMVVPTMLGRILDAMDRSGSALPSLRHLTYGGGRMPVPVLERAIGMLPDVGFVNAYGLTETSSTVAVLTPDDHRDAFGSSEEHVRARLGSVGRPLPSLELEIRDEEGRRLPAGISGEVWVRGEQVSGEYVGRSSPLDPEGWLATNDGGHLDDDGYLFVEGRLDDVIVRGGENISPGEIEDVLRTHPAVIDAAVLGLPDDEWGEIVAAAVVLDVAATCDIDELQTWVRERLRSTRCPAVVELRDELPYNEMGKLLRRTLKEQMARTDRNDPEE